MRVLVFEDNLLWSTRVKNALQTLGHQPELCRLVPEKTDALLAVVNLAAREYDPAEVVSALRALGVYVIGHAGHEEKALLRAGREAGCDRLATNSQIALEMEKLIGLANLPGLEKG